MIKIGIIGGAGYTAGELIRVLLNHPFAEIEFIYSTSNAGNPISLVHQDLFGDTELVFSNELNLDVDLLFLCLGHGNSKVFLEKHEFSVNTKIIDLSNDFRLRKDADFQGRHFVYGLPEFQKSSIKRADAIANPGCFATAIQLALLPLAALGALDKKVHINATTGATGAGVSPGATTHFAWRDNNFSVYKPFTHQHLGEIGETLEAFDDNNTGSLLFIPNRGNFSRGIFASVYTEFDGSLEKAFELYEGYYADEPFVHVSKNPIHLKQVVNTNKCLLHLMKHDNELIIYSVIDNLLKGASGQAVQNMNLMFGLEESLGLNLKASNF
ncbi:MAG: N-acetyl-gamma-glutamyl-phosphate reductase [Flavobacteriaceae bacterium]